MFHFTGGIANFSSSLMGTPNSFTNITHLLNVSGSPEFSDKIATVFEVCQDNTLLTQCQFTWKKQNNEMTVKKYPLGTNTFCSFSRLDLSSSTTTWRMDMSQMVNQSVSLVKVSIENYTLNGVTAETQQIILLEVLSK